MCYGRGVHEPIPANRKPNRSHYKCTRSFRQTLAGLSSQLMKSVKLTERMQGKSALQYLLAKTAFEFLTIDAVTHGQYVSNIDFLKVAVESLAGSHFDAHLSGAASLHANF